MTQKIRIECLECNQTQEYELDKVVVIGWIKKKLGVIYHEAKVSDLRKAQSELEQEIQAKIVRDSLESRKN